MRDVVVSLRLGPEAPRVLGLVVEVPGRRRIFVPMTRVTSIDAGQVITTGLVNMRRFEQRPTETLVLGEMLDRTVTLLDDGEHVAVVEDVGMEQQRTRDWARDPAVRPAPRQGAPAPRRDPHRRVGRRRAASQVEESGQGAANLLATFEKLNAADLADVLHELSRQAPGRGGRGARRRAARRRPRGAARGRPGRDPRPAARRSAPPTSSRRWQPDDAADLLSELPHADAEQLLELMEPDEAAAVRRLLAYDDDTAGGMMTTEPIILPPDATVAEALARVRQPELSPALAAQVYVCRPPMETPTGRFLGIAHIQRLLREPPSALVAGVVRHRASSRCGPTAPLAAVTHYLATYNLVARAGRRRERPPARRGHRRRRPGPPAARGLARHGGHASGGTAAAAEAPDGA